MNAPSRPLAAVASLSDRDLRIAGEAAAGCEGRLYVSRDARGLVMSSTEPDPGSTIFEVFRESAIPSKSGPARIVFQPTADGEQQELQHDYDALFWSGAAFEKFLLTYYGSLRLLSEQGMAKLKAAVADPQCIAFGHTPKSVPDGLGLVGDNLLVHLHAFKQSLMQHEEGRWIPISDFPLLNPNEAMEAQVHETAGHAR